MSARNTLTKGKVAALVVSTLIAGLVFRVALEPGASAQPIDTPPIATTETATAATAPAPMSPGPWSFENGIPIGFAHTEAGAIAAAASYTTMGHALIDLAPTQLPEAVDGYAAAGTAQQQVDTLSADLAALRQTLARGVGPTRYLKAILATRLDSYTSEQATVQVWAVGVLWRHGAADPQADWTTSSFELVWEDDTWKILTQRIASGPTPAPNAGTPPVNATELDRLLDGFAGWGATR